MLNHPVVMVMNGKSYKIFRSIFRKRKWMMKSAYIITWVNNNGDDDGKDEEKEKFLSPTLTDIQQVKKDSFLFFKVTTINAHYSL